MIEVHSGRRIENDGDLGSGFIDPVRNLPAPVEYDPAVSFMFTGADADDRR